MRLTPRGRRVVSTLALLLAATTAWHWADARSLPADAREVVVLEGPNGNIRLVDRAIVDRAEAQWRHRSDAAVLIREATLSPRASRSHARTRMSVYGWSHAEFACLDALWTRESNWRTRAYNPTPVRTANGPKHAGGIPQILGLDPDTPTVVQIRRGLEYIKDRYGSPCKAWRHWQWKHWY